MKLNITNAERMLLISALEELEVSHQERIEGCIRGIANAKNDIHKKKFTDYMVSLQDEIKDIEPLKDMLYDLPYEKEEAL